MKLSSSIEIIFNSPRILSRVTRWTSFFSSSSLEIIIVFFFQFLIQKRKEGCPFFLVHSSKWINSVRVCVFCFSSSSSFRQISYSSIHRDVLFKQFGHQRSNTKKTVKGKKKLFISMEGCGFVCDPFPSAQRAKFDPADCKNPLPFTILQLGLEMNRRELDTVCHPRGSLPIGICAQSSFLFDEILLLSSFTERQDPSVFTSITTT